MDRKSKALLLAALAALAAIHTLAQAKTPRQGRGEEWLAWASGERRLYVAAYLDGYSRGKLDACNAAGDLFEQDKRFYNLDDLPERRCFRHAKSYSENADDYVATVTAFYEKHPEHRDIPYQYFMLLFTDPSYKTVPDIEEGIRKGSVRTNF